MAAISFSHAPRFTWRRPRHEQDQEVMHIRDLVRLRRILARNGATPDELRSYDAEIDRQRRRLFAPPLAAS
jgi:hypothetical protein